MNFTLTPLDIIIIIMIIAAMIIITEVILNRRSSKQVDEEFIDRLRTGVEEGGLPLTTAQEVIQADVIAGKHKASR